MIPDNLILTIMSNTFQRVTLAAPRALCARHAIFRREEDGVTPGGELPYETDGDARRLA